LIKPSWKTIGTWYFIVLHLKNSLSYFLFRLLSRKKIILLSGYLGYVIRLSHPRRNFFPREMEI
jgi:hypothetical protein